MSVSYVPEERDIAQYSKFKLIFDRVPAVTFFCKTVNLPGIINNEVRVETPFSAFMVPGDKTDFGTLDVTFLVDVNYQTWKEVYNWITGLTFPKDFTQYQNLLNQQRTTLVPTPKSRGNQYSDAALTLYTNKNNPNVRVKFKDCFPVALGSIEYDVEKSAETPVTCSASFRYSLYEFEKL
jgi:hypothetical protein